MSLDNLSAIGKKEALMLTKEQIEMMLRINAPEVTLVQHIVRRPDLEKYWTYIRKINVNGHQTVWTQCTSKLPGKNALKGGEMSHYLKLLIFNHDRVTVKLTDRLHLKPSHG